MSYRNEQYSNETLFGFLIGALPTEETERIRSALKTDTDLASRLQDLRELLLPIHFMDEVYEPKADLVRATMSMIQNADAADQDQADKQRDGSQGWRMMSPLIESSSATKLAWLDSFVALAAGVIVLCVVLPSIFLSRESARRIACAGNLRELGQAIRSFAYASANKQVPAIEVGSSLSFAGVTTMRLRDAGLLIEQSKVWCPSIESIDVDQDIPTTLAFLSASELTKNNWRYSAGGNYSYNLGYVSEQDYVTPTLQTVSSYALAGDSLVMGNDNDGLYSIHGSSSANVLFSDGRVQLIRLNQIDASSVDHPYRNREGQQLAGTSEEDGCLGPSFQHPLQPIHFR